MDYEDYFKKKFVLGNVKEYQIPSIIFESPKWSIPTLQDKKRQLNEVKSLLNKYKLKVWSKHTSHRDHSGFVMKRLAEAIQPELLTQVGGNHIY